MWIDSHCHLDAQAFDSDRIAVIDRAKKNNISMLVIPAVASSNFSKVQTLARSYGFAYALGIHPWYVEDSVSSDLDLLEQSLNQAKTDPHLVAVGEIGLDYCFAKHNRDKQMQWYCAQLQLARRFNLPVILHVRRSADELLKGLNQYPAVSGIAHAFNGSLAQAKRFIDKEIYLGFGGTLTYERALQIRRLAQNVCANHLVLETDSPDMPPKWLYQTNKNHSGLGPQKPSVSRNEPAELVRIAKSLCELRNWNLQEAAHQTRLNSIRALPKLMQLMPI